MKPFRTLKIWMPLLGLGAVLAMAPQSRAQSEVSPDHFDRTDSRVVAAAKTPAPKTKQAPAPSLLRAGNNGPSTHASPQVVSAKDLSEFRRPEALAIPNRHKTPSPSSSNQ